MGTHHLSNELEASRKLHPKHIQLLLINKPLLDIQQTWKLKLSTSHLCITYFYSKKNIFCLRRNMHNVYQSRCTIFNLLRPDNEAPSNEKSPSFTYFACFAYLKVKQAKERNNPVLNICFLWCHRAHYYLSKCSDNVASWVFSQPLWPPNSCLVFILFQTWSLAGS